MFYNSTRNSGVKVSSAEAITQGISVEGGLFVPESIPQLTFEELKAIGDMKYADRAAYVFSKYLTDFTEAEIHYCTDNAYSVKNFESSGIFIPAYKLVNLPANISWMLAEDKIFLGQRQRRVSCSQLWH